MKNMPNSIESG